MFSTSDRYRHEPSLISQPCTKTPHAAALFASPRPTFGCGSSHSLRMWTMAWRILAPRRATLPPYHPLLPLAPSMLLHPRFWTISYNSIQRYGGSVPGLRPLSITIPNTGVNYEASPPNSPAGTISVPNSCPTSPNSHRVFNPYSQFRPSAPSSGQVCHLRH